jgi:hypothetical protein
MKLIPAKTIISGYMANNFWFGNNYNMNIYKGCCHGCIYRKKVIYEFVEKIDYLAKSSVMDVFTVEKTIIGENTVLKSQYRLRV